jgi:hypothetical protein
MSIYFDHFQNMFWKWSQLPPIRDQNILDSENRGRLRIGAWHCGRALSFFFPYYSHIRAICPFIVLYSPLIFLQQRLLESFIQAEKWGASLCLFTFWFVWRPNFARTALLTLLSLSPSHSSFLTLCHDSVLVVDSFCFGSLGLGSLLIVAALLLLFVRGKISLLFLQFHCF